MGARASQPASDGARSPFRSQFHLAFAPTDSATGREGSLDTVSLGSEDVEQLAVQWAATPQAAHAELPAAAVPSVVAPKETQMIPATAPVEAQTTSAGPLGVSAAFLRRFSGDVAAAHPDALASWTTTDLCFKYLVPLCQERRCSFVEWIGADAVDETGAPLFGPATHFVSHAWQYQYADVAEVMLDFAAAQSVPPFFWFDLFVNNQIEAVTLPQDWWSTTFRQAIKRIGAVLLILTPWHNPVPVTRAWCLWEIMCALTQEGIVLVAKMPRRQHDNLRECVRTGQWKEIRQALADTRSQSAQAAKAADRDMIFENIERTIGYAEINMRVNDLMRSWLVSVLDAVGKDCTARSAELFAAFEVSEAPLGSHFVDICHISSEMVCVAYALDSLEQHVAAADLMDYATGLVHRVAPPGLHAIMVSDLDSSKELLALHAKGQQVSATAMAALERQVDISELLFGANSRKTAIALVNLGGMIYGLGDCVQALAVVERGLAVFQQLPAGSDRDEGLAASYHTLTSIHVALGDRFAASECMSKLLEATLHRYGETHFKTADAYYKLGFLHFEARQYADAVAAFENAVAVRRVVAGDNSISLIRDLTALGTAQLLGSFNDDGIRTLQLALDIAESENIKDPRAITTYLNLSGALERSGQYTVAIATAAKALSIAQAHNGNDHVVTANCLVKIGNIYAHRKDWDNALHYISEARYILFRLPVQHYNRALAETAADALNNLGLIYIGKQDSSAALSAFQECLALRLIDAPTATREIAVAYMNIGQTLRLLDKNADAHIALKMSVAMHDELGQLDSRTADAMWALSKTHMVTKDYALALRILNDALAIYEATLGHNADRTNELRTFIEKFEDELFVQLRNREAQDVFDSGRRAEAVEMLAADVQRGVAGLPDSMDDLAYAYLDLGKVLSKMFDLSSAVEAMRLAVLHLQLCSEPDVCTVGRAEILLGALYQMSFQYDAALETFESARERLAQALGPNHRLTDKVTQQLDHIRMQQNMCVIM